MEDVRGARQFWIIYICNKIMVSSKIIFLCIFCILCIFIVIELCSYAELIVNT